MRESPHRSKLLTRSDGRLAGLEDRVSNTCVNTGVSGTSIVLLCQTWVESIDGGAIVAGGDSGSPMFISSGTNATLVGGLWGGSSGRHAVRV